MNFTVLFVIVLVLGLVSIVGLLHDRFKDRQHVASFHVVYVVSTDPLAETKFPFLHRHSAARYFLQLGICESDLTIEDHFETLLSK